MATENYPAQHDQEPTPMPGESDDAFRFRVRQWHSQKELELRQQPISPEDDARNREMLERLSRGDFSDPHDQAA